MRGRRRRRRKRGERGRWTWREVFSSFIFFFRFINISLQVVEGGKNVDVVVLRNHKEYSSVEENEVEVYVQEIEVEKKEAEEAAKLSKGQQQQQ